MATFRHDGDVGVYGAKFVGGMVARGYDPAFAERCFRQIEGFGSYGFPESHAVSFAKLVYVSAWIKHHRPDVFCAALLNSQPMGFYQPAQLVRDAREHGVEVRAADILLSDWDCTLEALIGRVARKPPGSWITTPRDRRQTPTLALPLPIRERRTPPPRPPGPAPDSGFEAGRGGSADRGAGGRCADFRRDRRAGGPVPQALELLADADALRSLGLDRRAGLWAVKGLAPEARAEAEAPLLAFMGAPAEAAVRLPLMALPAHVAEDYRTTSLSLKAHPCAFFRDLLAGLGVATAAGLKDMKDGRRVAVGGLVLIRQRPGTAKGVVFVTLEDETGSANAVVWGDVFAANRRVVMSSAFLIVHGRLQRAGEVIHVVAERFTDLTGRLAQLKEAVVAPSGPSPSPRLGRSRDFH